MTKKAKLENFDKLQAEKWMYELALNDVLNGDVVWSSWKHESSGGKYRVGHAGANRATGGAMITVFRQNGQRDGVGCFPWEEMFRTVRESQTGSEWASIVRACCYEIQGKAAA